MTTPHPRRSVPMWVSAVLGVLAVLFLVAAILYFTRTAGHLPSFFPGHQARSAHHHTKHGIALLVLSVVCLFGIWFGTGRRCLKRSRSRDRNHSLGESPGIASRRY